MKDLYGQELFVGDYIVYSDGDLRTINTGKIVGFTSKRVKLTVYHVNKYDKTRRTFYDTTVTPEKVVVVKGFKDPTLAIKPLLSDFEALNAKYVKNGGMKCPRCEDTNIDCGINMQFEDTTIYQDVTCVSCGETWDDVYELVRHNPTDE
ncbi:MAG: hypothetical protein DRI65_04405 [Chloroflexota bacterium]|nr:MAG: hypothetical protein DRI65_04405 [Chloroflexota bacterium]